MNPEVPRALEAILLVADSPLDTALLAPLVELTPAEVDGVLLGLAAEYAAQERGFALVRVAGGWRFQTDPAMAPYVERYVLEGQSAKLSAAALETLAIVAYKQPISRAQIATIRGVGVDGVVRTLEQRGYIGEVARDPGPGQAVLFGTTPAFLEKMGLDSLAQLPAIAEFVPGADVVEALEHGLRVEAAGPPDVAEPAPAPAPWSPSAVADHDGTDEATDIPDDIGGVDTLDADEDRDTLDPPDADVDDGVVDLTTPANDDGEAPADDGGAPGRDETGDEGRPSLDDLLDGDSGA